MKRKLICGALFAVSGLIGIAFAPGGTAILATSTAIYHVDLGIEGFQFR